MRMSGWRHKIGVFLKRQFTALLVPVLLVLFVAVYFSNRIIYNIMPGEAGVVWHRFAGGTQIDTVYAEGLRLIYPWDIMFIYNIRVQQTAHDFDVLTRSGLKIHLSISIRYAPEYNLLGVLHQKIGPDYVNIVVIPEVEAVLRVLIGRLEAEEVYTTERAILEKSINYAVEQVAQRYVNIDDVIIKQMVMPPMVETAIQEKIQQKQIAEAHVFLVQREKLEAERKRIEAEGLKQANAILDTSLSPQILRWRDIQATIELAKSTNAKVVVIGSAKDQFQLFGDIPLVPTEAAPSPPPVPIPTPLPRSARPITLETPLSPSRQPEREP